MSYGRNATQSKEYLQIRLENCQWEFLQKPAAPSCGPFYLGKVSTEILHLTTKAMFNGFITE